MDKDPETLEEALKMMKGWKRLYAETLDTLATARAEALREAAESQWINVKDRLPEERQLVIVCDVTADQPAGFIAFYYHEMKLWAMNAISFKVTHWMPFPQLPVIMVANQEPSGTDSNVGSKDGEWEALFKALVKLLTPPRKAYLKRLVDAEIERRIEEAQP